MAEKHHDDLETEAHRLGTSVRTLDRRIKDDALPFIRLGNRLLFDPQLSDGGVR